MVEKVSRNIGRRYDPSQRPRVHLLHGPLALALETLKMMQVIMQKLDQQAEELSAIKSALEQPPHTRQLASGAAAPVDYTGPASETAPQGMAKSIANSSIPLAPANTTPGAPLLSPRQQRLQQLKSSSVQGLREIGEG